MGAIRRAAAAASSPRGVQTRTGGSSTLSLPMMSDFDDDALLETVPGDDENDDIINRNHYRNDDKRKKKKFWLLHSYYQRIVLWSSRAPLGTSTSILHVLSFSAARSETRTRRILIALAALTFCGMLRTMLLSRQDERAQQRSMKVRAMMHEPPALLSFPHNWPSSARRGRTTTTGFRMPYEALGENATAEATVSDYGNLNVQILEEDGVKRTIFHDPRDDGGSEDYYDHRTRSYSYYAFDDDTLRNPYYGQKNGNNKGKKCRRVREHRLRFHNCNTVHEIDIPSLTRINENNYIGGGDYRIVYKTNAGYDDVAFKEYYWEADYDQSDYDNTRVDALLMERFTSSPRTVDIFAFCALGSVTELLPNGDLDSAMVPIGGRVEVHLSDTYAVSPQNNYTATEKLNYALQMAEAVALLHGYEGGVIVHDDIWLAQFLMTADGRAKLNDFNRAEMMLWNDRDQEYCKYRNGGGAGDWRAPEEFKDEPLDEKIDVWSLGYNMYAMLTGLYPFYDTLKNKQVREKIKRGKKPYIDPRYRTRSYAEKVLVEIMERCWVYNSEDRMDVFELVRLLREAVRINDEMLIKSSSN